MKTPTPIKRDKSLVLLSRDHHQGLMLVWKIRQGIQLNVAYSRAVAYVINVFDTDLQPHFVEEETLLFNKLKTEDELRRKAEDEHAVIRKKIAAFKTTIAPQVSDLVGFARLLEEHIRFEERILFPHLEKVLQRDELDKIGEQIRQDYANKKCVVWTDEFWLKK
jgi:hemerythrin-like domain-containing protein